MTSLQTVIVLMPDKHMGNLIVSLPAVAALKHHFAGSALRLVVDEAYRDIAAAAVGPEALMLLPRRKMRKASSLRRGLLYLSFVMELRGLRADLAIDLEGRDSSALLTLLTGASQRIGPSSTKRAYCYTRKVSLPTRVHRAETYLSIAKEAGVVGTSMELHLKADAGALNSVQEKVRVAGVPSSTGIVCIHPGAGKIYKQWTSEGFAAVADRLAEAGYAVVFVGSGHDAENIIAIRALMRERSFDLANGLTLGELIALFSQSVLYIGNDSGPLHLAAGSGVPVIGLYGPADEKRWRPLASKVVILRGAEPCSKCLGKDCQLNFRCIRDIRPDDLISEASKLLDQRQGK